MHYLIHQKSRLNRCESSLASLSRANCYVNGVRTASLFVNWLEMFDLQTFLGFKAIVGKDEYLFQCQLASSETWTWYGFYSFQAFVFV